MVVVLIISIFYAFAIHPFLHSFPTRRSSDLQSDLRNGLTAEKTTYTDTQTYDAVAANMKAIESSLDWGGKLTDSDGKTVNANDDKSSVCLLETSKTGTVFSIGDVSAGPNAGT